MAKKTTKKTKNKNQEGGGDNMIWVDPARVRFQHARIRPHFSGCGRSVVDTLEEIRQGRLRPSDLPPIQVLVGPIDEESDDQPWYFSLNNRRLWVLKRCREQGLLNSHDNKDHVNQVQVRVRAPKSAAERNRYTLQNCALEAKFMSEKKESAAASVNASSSMNDNNKDGEERKQSTMTVDSNESEKRINHRTDPDIGHPLPDDKDDEDDEEEEEDSSSDDDSYRPHNPFSVLESH